MEGISILWHWGRGFWPWLWVKTVNEENMQHQLLSTLELELGFKITTNFKVQKLGFCELSNKRKFNFVSFCLCSEKQKGPM